MQKGIIVEISSILQSRNNQEDTNKTRKTLFLRLATTKPIFATPKIFQKKTKN